MPIKPGVLGNELIALAAVVGGAGRGYAASHVARSLAAQWKPALSSGAQLADLLGDVDDVISQLLSFRIAAASLGDLIIDPTALELENFSESGSDFKFRENAKSCWISIDTIGVHVLRNEEGVAVELFTNGADDSERCATLSFDDAEDALVGHLGVDIEHVASWVTQQYQISFDAASLNQRHKWIHAYNRFVS
jgi:hypothetical protein